MNTTTRKQEFINECFSLQKSEGEMVEELTQEYAEIKGHIDLCELMNGKDEGGNIMYINGKLQEGGEDYCKKLKHQLHNTNASNTYSKRKRKFYIYAHNLDLPNAIRMNEKIIKLEYEIMEFLEDDIAKGETINSHMINQTDGGKVINQTDHKGDDAYLTTCNHFKGAQEARTMCMKVMSLYIP